MSTATTTTSPLSYTWEIVHFSSCANLLYHEIKHPTNAHISFNFQLYPHGSLNYLNEHTLLELYYISSDKVDDEAQFRLAIVGTKQKVHYEGTLLRRKNASVVSFQTNINRKGLLDPEIGLLQSGKLVIHIELFLSGEDGGSTTLLGRLPGIFSETARLQVDLLGLLQNGQQSDVTVVVGEAEFKLHRSILTARSPAFGALLEGNPNRIVLENVNSLVAFEHLLIYIYTGRIPEMSGNVTELFQLAIKYGVDSLKVTCEEVMSRSLSIESVADVLYVADLNCASTLKEQCIRFVNEHSAAVIQTEGWRNLMKNRLELVLELYEQKARRAGQ